MHIKYHFKFPGSIDYENVDTIAIEDIKNNDSLLEISKILLYRKLRDTYKDIKITPVNTDGIVQGHTQYQKFSFPYTIIENADTKKYIVICWADRVTGMVKETGWDMENCVEVFTSLGVHWDDVHYTPHPEARYTPSTHITTMLSAYNTIEELHKLKLVKAIPKKLFFRGGSYLFREWLYLNDSRFDMHPSRINGDDFIRELARYSINMDINGVGEISCRSLDAMGLQTALIRPKLTIQYHNPLIPDYHYAEVKCNDLGDFKGLADAYIEKFEELKKDPDLVNFLSKNGREWYEQNATIESYLEIHLKLINLNKLL